MNVAAGATGPFTPQERSQLGGCAFNAIGEITGGCGAGGDTITFSPPLTQIILSSNLPQIIKDGVTINGAVSAGTIIINANAAVNFGFRVNANQVTLTNLTIVNTSGTGHPHSPGKQPLDGAANLQQLHRRAARIHVVRWRLRYHITAVRRRPAAGRIGDGWRGPWTAYIDNNVIGCAVNDGISNQEAPYRLRGPERGRWIGRKLDRGQSSRLKHRQQRQGDRGVLRQYHNRFPGSRQSHCLQSAARVEVQGPLDGALTDNDVFANGGAGIRLIDSRAIMLTNNLAHANGSSGIWLHQTSSTPGQTRDNKIVGGAYFRNGAAGISEHANADANTWSQISTYANLGLGIDSRTTAHLTCLS